MEELICVEGAALKSFDVFRSILNQLFGGVDILELLNDDIELSPLVKMFLDQDTRQEMKKEVSKNNNYKELVDKEKGRIYKKISSFFIGFLEI